MLVGFELVLRGLFDECGSKARELVLPSAVAAAHIEETGKSNATRQAVREDMPSKLIALIFSSTEKMAIELR